MRKIFSVIIIAACLAVPAAAQQRPLVTEDPEPIGSGRLLIEGGLDYAHGQQYPVSGLQGNLWRAPALGVSIGLSSIAEFQIDGGLINHVAITSVNTHAPLAGLLTVTGNTTRGFDDIVVGTKIRLISESGARPAVGFRFATRLPNARNETGLGLDTTDVLISGLVAKTVQSVRVVGNIGLGILGDPTDGQHQNDVVTYGLSIARAITDHAEVVGDLNGRASMRTVAFPGTESLGQLRLGARYTRAAVRFDAGVVVGLTSLDQAMGFTTGLTYVFHAFSVP